MAEVDKSIAALGGAPESGSKIEIYQRDINLATVALGGVGNLANGDWVELFDTEAGDMVLGGSLEVVTVDAGGGTLQLGLAGGTGVDGPRALSSKALFGMGLSTPGVGVGPITMAAATAAVTTARVKVTLAVLKAGDFSG